MQVSSCLLAHARTRACGHFHSFTHACTSHISQSQHKCPSHAPAVDDLKQDLAPKQSVSTPQTPKPSSKDSNELEEFFVCDYNCGFRSDYASVEEHEKTCPLKQSRSITLAQQQQVSVTLQPFVHPDLRIHSRPRTMHVCHLCK
jgi:hypothetical protein